MSFARLRSPGLWAPNSVIEPEEFEQLDENLSHALDGKDGGAYAPTNPLDIGGAGFVFGDGAIQVNGGIGNYPRMVLYDASDTFDPGAYPWARVFVWKLIGPGHAGGTGGLGGGTVGGGGGAGGGKGGVHDVVVLASDVSGPVAITIDSTQTALSGGIVAAVGLGPSSANGANGAAGGVGGAGARGGGGGGGGGGDAGGTSGGGGGGGAGAIPGAGGTSSTATAGANGGIARGGAGGAGNGANGAAGGISAATDDLFSAGIGGNGGSTTTTGGGGGGGAAGYIIGSSYPTAGTGSRGTIDGTPSGGFGGAGGVGYGAGGGGGGGIALTGGGVLVAGPGGSGALGAALLLIY